MLGKMLILKRKLAMSPLYTEKTCIERVTPQLTSFFFFFFLYCWSFEKLFVLEYS